MKSATLALDFGGEGTALPLDGKPETDAPHLLATLRGRGVIVATDGEKLLLDAPRGALEDLLPDLQRFKPSLLELLEAAPSPDVLRHAAPDEGARSIEEARRHLKQLEKLRGSAGACRAIWKASRRLKREQTGFWRRLKASERHALAVCVALLGEGDGTR